MATKGMNKQVISSRRDSVKKLALASSIFLIGFLVFLLIGTTLNGLPTWFTRYCSEDVAKSISRLNKGSWTGFAVGTGFALSTVVTAGAAGVTYSACQTSLAAASAAQPIWPATSLACIGSAGLASVASSVAGGLFAFGYGKGWVFESNGSENQTNVRGDKFFKLQTGHYIVEDTELARSLNRDYNISLSRFDSSIITALTYTNDTQTFKMNDNMLYIIMINDNGTMTAVSTDGINLGMGIVNFLVNKEYDGGIRVEAIEEDANYDKSDDTDSKIVDEIYINAYGG
ncbi:hypothetical protein V1509DRAFT_624590 [Lipomyces kononenkoae]